MACIRFAGCWMEDAADRSMWPQVTNIKLRGTCRLIPSRYSPQGVLDLIARPEDLDLIFELEGWTDDRIAAELGVIHLIPDDEWVVGRPLASVIMAAYCHPRPEGSRFNGPNRGAWYAAFTLAAAHGEATYHRTRELLEIGVQETSVHMRLYRANFLAAFHDIRSDIPDHSIYHSPSSYEASQELAQRLLEHGSNGILYRSVRHAGGECIACFRSPLVLNVKAGPHYEYVWEGAPEPRIRRLG